MNTTEETKVVSLVASTQIVEGDISEDLLIGFACNPLFQYSVTTTESDLEKLLERFPDQVWRVQRWRDESGLSLKQAVLRFGERSIVHLRADPTHCAHIYASTASEAEALEKQIRDVLTSPNNAPESPSFYLLCQRGPYITSQRVSNSAPKLDDESLQLAYGVTALSWMGSFAEDTESKPGGLTIFDGPPGTGKSTMVSQLMHRLRETHVFYVLTVAQNIALSDERMVEFWQEQNERWPKKIKIVVIEDAERILLQRRSDNDEAVSALLNVADGLLGQMLRLHIICTLNQLAEQLDPAIVRPGRLRCHLRTELLTGAVALKLAQKHQTSFRLDEERDRYTLAEVFHGNAFNRPSAAPIGFRQM